jgi:hypothetical protein
MEENISMESDAEPGETEHWYRYHANIGTFYAHRWLKTKDRKRMEDMERGRKHIARGIEIKPNAHFAREPYQLMAMEWILDGCQDTFLEFMRDAQEKKNEEDGKRRIEKSIEGLSGLIVLGAAWESIDIFAALSSQLDRNHHDKVAYLADLRVGELQKNGRKSLSMQGMKPYAERWHPRVTGIKTLETQYKMLREDAEAWHTERINYMMKRLEAGKHPDTHPDFWNEYKERPKPSLGVPWYQDIGEIFFNWLFGKGGILLIPVVAFIGLASFIIARKIRNKIRNH